MSNAPSVLAITDYRVAAALECTFATLIIVIHAYSLRTHIRLSGKVAPHRHFTPSLDPTYCKLS